MTKYEEVRRQLTRTPARWLVTGAAGFIGSHLVDALLRLGQRVVGLDNFSTGRRENLSGVRELVGDEIWTRFEFREGDTTSATTCEAACTGVDFVLHQAALGSVPRSLADPLVIHASNVNGFIEMLNAARTCRVRRFVYASSSSIYGDNPALPKQEPNIGKPLSPYAATKLIDEIYAGVFHRCYGVPVVGLRYFNVFGPRQDPKGPYAAVIPRWFAALSRGEPISIFGDGESSRDFCFVENVVQANLLAAVAGDTVNGMLYNIACGERTTLRELAGKIWRLSQPNSTLAPPIKFGVPRAGDVRHSLADISRAQADLGYVPLRTIDDGLELTARWQTMVNARSGPGP